MTRIIVYNSLNLDIDISGMSTKNIVFSIPFFIFLLIIIFLQLLQVFE